MKRREADLEAATAMLFRSIQDLVIVAASLRARLLAAGRGADSTKFKSSAYWVVREAAEGISAMKKLKREGDRQEP